MRKTIAVCLWGLSAAGAAEAHAPRTLYSFCQPDCTAASGPSWGVVRDGAGNLFGIATSGTDQLIYELQKPRHGVRRLKPLHVLCGGAAGCNEGGNLQAGLIQDVAGNLYGVASQFGAKGNGTAFELFRGAGGRAWHLHVLHAFPRTSGDGGFPQGRLTYAGAQSGALYDGVSPLYGTTERGGAADAGTVYRLTPSSGGGWTSTVLYSFASGSDGAIPLAGVTMDAAGNLYGTTEFGGNHAGTVYKLSDSSGGWVENVLYRFCSQPNCTDSANPTNELTMDSSGVLYGTATTFGSGHGTIETGGGVFKLTPDGGAWDFQELHGFCAHNTDCHDGSTPSSGVLMDTAGNLYGLTINGGQSGDGVAYRIAPDGTYKVLHSFCSEANCADGKLPLGNLMLDPHGLLFGTTLGGGAFGTPDGGGTVFQLRP